MEAVTRSAVVCTLLITCLRKAKVIIDAAQDFMHGVNMACLQFKSSVVCEYECSVMGSGGG